jgi:hypothetical protein
MDIIFDTNWKLLREQKQTLLAVIDATTHDKDADHLTGILHFIDYIQDEAAKEAGEEIVFG